MDKNKVVKYMSKQIGQSAEHQQMIQAIEEAKKQWEVAMEYFEQVSEPKLVDYAIYMEYAAKIRYEYLLLEAKKKGIKVNPDCWLREDEVAN